MARLYSNENFPLPVVEALRTLGHDVLTIQETGRADQSRPDKDVLDFATKEQRAVLTLNRLHFIRLHHEQSGGIGLGFLNRRMQLFERLPYVVLRPDPVGHLVRQDVRKERIEV